MYGLSATNSAFKAPQTPSTNNLTDTSGGPTSRKTNIGYFVGQKFGEVVMGGLLGYWEGHDGEPMFFSSDPTKAVGLKFLGTVVSNIVEFVRIWIGEKAMVEHHMPGALGAGIDGALRGISSAFTVAFVYDQANTYGAAKRAQEKASTTTSGLNYADQKKKELPAAQPSAAQVAGVSGGQSALEYSQQEARRMSGVDFYQDMR